MTLFHPGLSLALLGPGGNITGMSELDPELGAKRLELLNAAVPMVTRVAVMWNPAFRQPVFGKDHA